MNPGSTHLIQFQSFAKGRSATIPGPAPVLTGLHSLGPQSLRDLPALRSFQRSMGCELLLIIPLLSESRFRTLNPVSMYGDPNTPDLLHPPMNRFHFAMFAPFAAIQFPALPPQSKLRTLNPVSFRGDRNSACHICSQFDQFPSALGARCGQSTSGHPDQSSLRTLSPVSNLVRLGLTLLEPAIFPARPNSWRAGSGVPKRRNSPKLHFPVASLSVTMEL